MRDLHSAIEQFSRDGIVPDALLLAYDQTGKKIPRDIMPIWEPDEYIEELVIPDDVIWEDFLMSAPQPPRFHDQLPESIPLERVSKIENGKSTLMTSYFHHDQNHTEIPYHHIKGDVVLFLAASVEAPNLETIDGTIYASMANSVKLNNLRVCKEDIKLQQARVFEANSLEEVQCVDAGYAENVELDNLRIAEEVWADCADTLSLKKIERVGQINATAVRTILIPNLVEATGDLDFGFATKIDAGKLKRVGGILNTESARNFYRPDIEAHPWEKHRSAKKLWEKAQKQSQPGDIT